MDWLAELRRLLRPAGGGVYVVSTGVSAQAALQRKLYGASDQDAVQERFLEALAALPSARGVLLGIPSDVGAGLVRGANLGPQVIRAALMENGDFGAFSREVGLVDLGDVFVVPQLLHDEMLSEGQKEACRKSLYPDVEEEDRRGLPVSPLSIAERVLELVFRENPDVKPFVMGGDHSTAWPVVAALARARRDRRWGIVQPDAHTDLLEERLGVRYCFATWSYHANELLGRNGRLVQVGVRASRRPKEHWEGVLGVRQFWAEECRTRPEATLDAVIGHLKERGVEGVYFSNDIDGTDSAWADATGTPEPWGLEPDFVVRLIRRLGAEIGLLGGDIMEVAPPLRQIPRGAKKTTDLAARYLKETIAAALVPR